MWVSVLLVLGTFVCGLQGESSRTLFAFGQDDEVLESTERVKEVKLSFPVKFGQQLHGSLFINEKGFVSFRPTGPSFHPLSMIQSPMVAPFLSDIDATSEGKIYYREERKNTDELIKFDGLVKKYFGRTVETKSLLVVTWVEVPPRITRDTTKYNTFQVIIGSGEGECYVALSYPRAGIQWAEASGELGRPSLWSQVGLIDGYGSSIILKESGGPRMLSLDRRSNVGSEGLFFYRVDGELEEPKVSVSYENNCESNDDPCNPEGVCSSKEDHYCCACATGSVGNGYLCLPSLSGAAFHVSGKIEGTLNDQRFGPSDLYGFGNLSSGVSYLSIQSGTAVPVGDLQSLFPITGGLHWIFGKSTSDENGFFLTEGRFNLTTEVRFMKQERASLRIIESFNGLGHDNILHVTVRVDGFLPSLKALSQVQIPEYVNVFYRSGPGVLRSNSSQTLVFDDPSEDPLEFSIDQTIRFDQSVCDNDLLELPVKVVVNRGSVRVDERKIPPRIHMHAEVDFRIGQSALNVCAGVDCGDAICVPNGEIDYRCVCNQGAEFRNGECHHQSVATSMHRTCSEHPPCGENSRCFDTQQGPICRCLEGFRENGRHCELSQASAALSSSTCPLQCHPRASCLQVASGYVCRCMPGTIGDGRSSCRPITCEDDPRICPQNSHCSRGVCSCNNGFVGDGTFCKRQESSGKNGDRIIYSRGITVLEVTDITSRHASPKLLSVGDDDSEIVGIAVDCDRGQIYFSDSMNGKIFRVQSDGKNREIILSGLSQPEGIAVDSSSRNVFWVDSAQKKIQVTSMDNFAYTFTVVGTDLDSPRGIAVHPRRGKVYFTDRSLDSPRIESVSMDGNDRTKLVRNDLEVPNMLAIDVQADELCWSDAGRKSIECISLDPSIVPTESSRRVVYQSTAFNSKIFGLAIHQKRIYWTDWDNTFIHVLDRGNATQLEPEKYATIAADSSRLYSVAIASQHCPQTQTSCEVRRGDCPYMCLPTDSYGRNCVCPESIQKAGRCPAPTSPAPL